MWIALQVTFKGIADVREVGAEWTDGAECLTVFRRDSRQNIDVEPVDVCVWKKLSLTCFECLMTCAKVLSVLYSLGETRYY